MYILILGESDIRQNQISSVMADLISPRTIHKVLHVVAFLLHSVITCSKAVSHGFPFECSY